MWKAETFHGQRSSQFCFLRAACMKQGVAERMGQHAAYMTERLRNVLPPPSASSQAPAPLQQSTVLSSSLSNILSSLPVVSRIMLHFPRESIPDSIHCFFCRCPTFDLTLQQTQGLPSAQHCWGCRSSSNTVCWPTLRWLPVTFLKWEYTVITSGPYDHSPLRPGRILWGWDSPPPQNMALDRGQSWASPLPNKIFWENTDRARQSADRVRFKNTWELRADI